MDKNVKRLAAWLLAAAICLALIPAASGPASAEDPRDGEAVLAAATPSTPWVFGFGQGYVSLGVEITNYAEGSYFIWPFTVVTGPDGGWYSVEAQSSPGASWRSLSFYAEAFSVYMLKIPCGVSSSTNNSVLELTKPDREKVTLEARIPYIVGEMSVVKMDGLEMEEVSDGIFHFPGQSTTCTVAGLEEFWTDGTNYYTDAACTVQAAVKDLITQPPGHVLGEWVTEIEPSGCDMAGEMVRRCVNCSNYMEKRYIPAQGHLWGEWTTTQEPDGSQDGRRQRVCRRDPSHVQTQAIVVSPDWFTVEDGVLVGYSGPDGTIYIPDGVTGIAGSVFDGKKVYGVIIPDSVKTIGDYAFEWQQELAYIDLGNSVTEIGVMAFSGACVTSLTLPDSVRVIGEGAFQSLQNMTRLDLGGGVAEIGEFAFTDSAITSLTIPGNVKTVGKGAFAWCGQLTEINLPDTDIEMGDGAFYECEKLKDNGMILHDGILYEYCGEEQDVVIPDGVTRICGGSFAYFSDPVSLVIPASVTSIGGNAFVDCKNLATVTFLEPEDAALAGGAFPNYVADEHTIGCSAFENCESLAEIRIPEGYIGIDEYVFSGCSALAEVGIPRTMQRIDEYAFCDCPALTAVLIPAGVASIGEKAFGYYHENAEDDAKKLEGFTVIGWEGSEAQAYAESNGFKFINVKNVTFHSNFDTDAVTVQNVYSLTDTALAENPYTREGYSFSCWNTVQAPGPDNGGVEYRDGQTVSLSGDLELWAQWTPYPAEAPRISSQPVDAVLVYGYDTAGLKVEAEAADGYELAYQWYCNTGKNNTGGTAIEGANGANHILPAGMNAGTEAYFYCEVTATRKDNGLSASVSSEAAAVTVVSPLTAEARKSDDGSVTVTVTQNTSEDARVWVLAALYDTSGKLLDYGLAEVGVKGGPGGTEQCTVSCPAGVAGTALCRLILADTASGEPLCGSSNVE